jgi:hypothetical protein
MASVTPAAQPGRKRKGILSSPITVIVVLGVALGAGAWILLRRRAAASAATAAPSAAQAQDDSGQISTLQAEVADLQGRLAQSGGDEDDKGGTTAASKPGMPTHVAGSATSATTIRLTWSKVAGATMYKAYATYQGKQVGMQQVTGLSATLPGLTPNHTYTCHVAACNAAGCSSATNGPVVKTPGAIKAPVSGKGPGSASGGSGGGESEAA